MSEIDTIGDDQDERDCNGCGQSYVFVVGQDTGYCAGCRLRLPGRPGAEERDLWRHAIARSAERRAMARAARRAR